MKAVLVLAASLVIPPGVLRQLAHGPRPVECRMEETYIRYETGCVKLVCSNGAKKWESKDALCDGEEDLEEIEDTRSNWRERFYIQNSLSGGGDRV